MNDFLEIKQKPPINNLITFNKDLYKIQPTDLYLGNKEFAFVLDKTKEFELAPSTLQLLLYILVKASALNLDEQIRYININLSEYLALRDNENPVSARRKINKDLSRLLSLHIRFEDINYKDKKSNLVSFHMNLFSSISKFKGGEIQIALTEEFIKYYNTLPKMYLPTKIFEIDTRYNPNAFYILWELAYLYNINKKNKDRANMVLVKTLLNYCPKIPKKFREIKLSGQQYQRIIHPFERDMQTLSNIIDWYYMDALGNIKQVGRKSLENFLELKIIFKFKDLEKFKKLTLGKDNAETIPTYEI